MARFCVLFMFVMIDCRRPGRVLTPAATSAHSMHRMGWCLRTGGTRHSSQNASPQSSQTPTARSVQCLAHVECNARPPGMAPFDLDRLAECPLVSPEGTAR